VEGLRVEGTRFHRLTDTVGGDGVGKEARKSERGSERARARACVCERASESARERERERERASVCVCRRERQAVR